MAKYKIEFDNKNDYYNFLNSRLSYWATKVRENLSYLDHPIGINISYFKPAKEEFQELEKYAQLLEEFEKEERNEEDE